MIHSTQVHCQALLDQMEALRSERNREGMARYGINVEHALGISVTALRRLARGARGDHTLAQCLWNSGIHEARILASMVDEPAQVTRRQTPR